MNGLVLHCGAKSATREQVFAVPTPASTESWVPVPHGNILENVQAQLGRAGMSVMQEAHGLTHGGNRYFGLLEMRQDGGDFGIVVGVRNSHDKTFPAALVLGARVFVCDNLSFCGEVKLARKHTTNILRDLPQVIGRAVGLLGDLRTSQERRFDAYRNTELSVPAAHDLVIQAVDSRVIPVTRIPDVLQEWREPRYPEFAGRNVWSLWNGFTEVLKGNLAELPKRTQALHGVMDAACRLVAETPVAMAV